MRLFLLATAALAASACVPTSFSYGSGGGGGEGGSGGQGGGPGCGDGVLQAGETCDLGLANSDDFDDTSFASTTLDDPGCTRSCQPAVLWSWGLDSDFTESAVFGLVATDREVFVGGAAADFDILDTTDLHFSGNRLFARLDPETGAERFVTTENSDGYAHAIFGLSRRSSSSVFVLESTHVPSVQIGTYLSVWEGDVEVADTRTDYVGLFEGSGSAIGGFGNDGRVLALGARDGGIVRLGRADDLGAAEIVDLPQLSGRYESGAITVNPGVGFYAGWNNTIVSYDDDLNEITSIPSIPNLDIKSACTRNEDEAVFVGWRPVEANGSFDAIVMVVNGISGEIVFEDEWDGPVGGVDGASAVACDADGSFVVVGEESLFEGSDPTRRTYSRTFVRRYDADLSLRWTRTHRSPIASTDDLISDNDAFAVAIGPDGGIYVGGREMSSTTAATAWVRKYSP